MSETLHLHRRQRRENPMHSLRVGLAAASGGGPAAEAEFPGAVLPDPETARGRLLSGGLSLLIHALVILALALAAWLAPQEMVDQVIEITRLPDQVNEQESAPRPKVLAESAGRFDPAPMALDPRVVNPAVIQRRANAVEARKVDVATVSPVQAPRDIQRTAREVETVSAYQSVATATAQPVAVEAPSAALTGPIELQAPVGVSGGPRQVTTVGSTVGIGGPHALGTGSSVRDGVASDRDVLGAREGARADVNWSVGAGGGRGTGGNGTGPGGVSFESCVARPEVQQYMAAVQQRVLSRWVLPPDVRGDQFVQLRFVLDPAGTANRVEFSGGSAQLGDSAVKAMRAASPFDQMPDGVRCLAGTPIVGTFRNPTIGAN